MSEGAVGNTTQEDFERLANRIAMLAGDEGEVDAAGRAVGNLARRLGLSGGHLKAIFLAGAGRLAAAGRQAAEQSARADRFQTEAGQLQHSLDQVDFAYRQVSRERDEAVAQAEAYRDALARARGGRRVGYGIGGLAILVAAGVVALALLGPPLQRLGFLGLSFGSGVTGHTATVRPPGAVVLVAPDEATEVLYRLPAGVIVPVDQLVWRNFNQWAELTLGGRRGYIVVTSLTLQRDRP
jgi:hypothetical protein